MKAGSLNSNFLLKTILVADEDIFDIIIDVGIEMFSCDYGTVVAIDYVLEQWLI